MELPEHTVNYKIGYLNKNVNTINITLTLVYLMPKNPFSEEFNNLRHDGPIKGSGNLIGSPSSPNQ